MCYLAVHGLVSERNVHSFMMVYVFISLTMQICEGHGISVVEYFLCRFWMDFLMLYPSVQNPCVAVGVRGVGLNGVTSTLRYAPIQTNASPDHTVNFQRIPPLPEWQKINSIQKPF